MKIFHYTISLTNFQYYQLQFVKHMLGFSYSRDIYNYILDIILLKKQTFDLSYEENNKKYNFDFLIYKKLEYSRKEIVIDLNIQENNFFYTKLKFEPIEFRFKFINIFFNTIDMLFLKAIDKFKSNIEKKGSGFCFTCEKKLDNKRKNHCNNCYDNYKRKREKFSSFKSRNKDFNKFFKLIKKEYDLN